MTVTLATRIAGCTTIAHGRSCDSDADLVFLTLTTRRRAWKGVPAEAASISLAFRVPMEY